MIETMLELGMEPVITLSHYETPLHLITDMEDGVTVNSLTSGNVMSLQYLRDIRVK